MGWGCHPDTMAIATAQHAAKQEEFLDEKFPSVSDQFSLIEKASI